MRNKIVWIGILCILSDVELDFICSFLCMEYVAIPSAQDRTTFPLADKLVFLFDKLEVRNPQVV